MGTNFTQRATVVVMLTTFLFLGAGCMKKKKTSLNSGAWLSEFSTITTTGVTDASAWELNSNAGTDPAGNLYVSGTTDRGWVVLKSSDGGENWTEEFLAGSGSYGHHIAADSLGNVFAVGSTGGFNFTGTIVKYDADLETWSTVYSAQIEPGKLTYLQGLAIDGDDNIYATGVGKVTLLSPDGWPDMDVTKMIVLKSTDHGSSWNLVDSYAIDDYSYTTGAGAFIAETGEVYAFGYGRYTTRAQSVIRKSTDNGATWTRVYEDVGTNIRSLSAWGNNLIFNEDYYNGEYDSTAARMRGTTDSFAHLTVIDSFAAPDGSSTLLTGRMKIDSKGHVYYPLQYWDVDGYSHLVLRGNRGDGEWETLDDYVAESGEALYVNEVLIGNDDTVYNFGVHYTDSGTSWIFRKASLSSTDAVTPEDVEEGDLILSPAPSGAKRIYITSLTHDGYWGSTPTSALANADAACNSDPNVPLNGVATYKAMIVNSMRKACTTPNCSGGSSENLNWVLAPSTNYVNREGLSLGTTDTSGIFTNFSRALLSNHVELAWTGLESWDRNWTVDSWACNDFTSNDGGDWGTIWTPRATDYGDIYTGGAWNTCDTPRRLICVEQ